MTGSDEKLVYVGSVARLVEARQRIVTLVGAHEILAMAVGGRIFVIGNRCPHLVARLDQWGVIDAEKLEFTCRLHAWNFSLETGEELWEPCRRRLTIYETVIRDGRVFARLPAEEPHDRDAE